MLETATSRPLASPVAHRRLEALLGISIYKSTWYRWLERGAIPHLRIGADAAGKRRIYVQREDLDRFAERCEEAGFTRD
jgi:hypothetical protein